MNKTVYLIIGFNEFKLTRDSVSNFTKYIRSPDKIVLVDNGSRENLESIAKEYKVEFLRIPINQGYASGCNKAAEFALSKFPDYIICITGNDLRINKQFFNNLEPQLKIFNNDKNCAALCPTLYQDKALTKVDSRGLELYKSGLVFQNRRSYFDNKKVILNTSYVFFKPLALKKLKRNFGTIFNTSLFMLGDDIDISLKLLILGYTLDVTRYLKVHHLGSMTSGKTPGLSFYLSWRNTVWITLMTRSKFELLIDLPYLILGQLVLIIMSLKNRQVKPIFKTYLDVYKQRKVIASQRGQFMFVNKSERPPRWIRNGVLPIYYLEGNYAKS